jgi:hypothetical protein
MTSLKKRLDYVVDELSNMTTEPNPEASQSIHAQLAIIKGAFKESENYPVCCFKYDDCSRIVCDVCGPLPNKEFMVKCKQCQAQIKNLLSVLS